MLGQQRLQHLSPPGLDRDERAGLVSFHQPAVPDDISGKDGGEATFHTRLPPPNCTAPAYWNPCRKKHLGCQLMAQLRPTETSAVWRLLGVKQTSVSRCSTITIHRYAP